jgi:DNA helicase HerA-like ATPase
MRVNMDGGGVIHIGRIDFRNDNRVFGIKHEDRFSHVYIIGKTGTGKSTLLETMALQDLERGNGFALIDPHGDLVSRIAARIPASQRPRKPVPPKTVTRRMLIGRVCGRSCSP